MARRTSPLAHSARPKKGIKAQTYPKHILRVTTGAVNRAREVAKFAHGQGALLVAVERLSGEFHDLGKLDDLNQNILATSTSRLQIPHEDAGVSHLLRKAAANADFALAAIVIFSHHKGLQSIYPELDREEEYLRNCDPGPDGRPLWQFTDDRLESYLRSHNAFVKCLPSVETGKLINAPPPPMLYRIALSCLVDADHSDTARHYKKAIETKVQPLRATERLTSLDGYVAKLSDKRTDSRSQRRQAIYDACRQRNPKASSLWECDSPVGTGKTTAVMAHLLRAAEAKGLRRLIVVLPFTNIIDQAVDVYRRSMVLPGEDPEAIVAAHHHKADYQQIESRHLAALWRSPIVVTTAVQFFETLAASSTGGLRKLHELVGAGVFIDESHASLPAKLWPQAWAWIRELANEWGGHFVLGSGSLNRIWTMPEFTDEQPQELPPLVESSARPEAARDEDNRVKRRTREDPLTLDQLAKWIVKHDGPRIVIVNTVQIAAALADLLAEQEGRDAVMHLSTALTPHHRALTLEMVKARLVYGTETNWTLVATSCVEAGVELSFRSGLRQRSSLCSLLQLCGRVSRNDEYPGADVWDFTLVPSGLVNENRDLKDATDVLGMMFKENKIGPEHCTEALKREVLMGRKAKLHEELQKAEQSFDFPGVQRLFRVIDYKTQTAVVSKTLQKALERGERVDWRELQRHSVQIHSDKVEKLSLPKASRMPDVFFWNLPYNEFIGYMAGALPLVKGDLEGGFIF